MSDPGPAGPKAPRRDDELVLGVLAVVAWAGFLVLVGVNVAIWHSVNTCIASCTAKGMEVIITYPATFLVFGAAVGLTVAWHRHYRFRHPKKN